MYVLCAIIVSVKEIKQMARKNFATPVDEDLQDAHKGQGIYTFRI